MVEPIRPNVPKKLVVFIWPVHDRLSTQRLGRMTNGNGGSS
jgi:hypothetical protein